MDGWDRVTRREALGLLAISPLAGCSTDLVNDQRVDRPGYTGDVDLECVDDSCDVLKILYSIELWVPSELDYYEQDWQITLEVLCNGAQFKERTDIVTLTDNDTVDAPKRVSFSFVTDETERPAGCDGENPDLSQDVSFERV